MQIKSLFKSVLIILFCLFVVNIDPLYAWKISPPKNKEESKKPEVADQSKQLEATASSLQEKNNALTKLYGELKADRDNLLVQTKRLLEENKEYAGMKASMEDLAKEKTTIAESEAALKKENETANDNFETLKGHLGAMVKEKSRLEQSLAEAIDTRNDKESNVRARFEKEYQGRIAKLAELKSENIKLTNQTSQLKKDIKILEEVSSRSKKENVLLEERLAEAESTSKRLTQENVMLTDEARSFPVKFADLARQNKKLIDETADTHYNLGVFYVHNKEYKRAIQEFGKTLKIRPHDPQANYNLGYLYAEHIVDRPKAMEYFKSYLTYAPNAADADWVRRYLLTWETWQGKEIR